MELNPGSDPTAGNLIVSPTPVLEEPLATGKVWQLILGATCVLATFYLYCIVALIVTGVLYIVSIFLVVLAHYGIGEPARVSALFAKLRLVSKLIRSGLYLESSPEYGLKLRAVDAPRLFKGTAAIARRAGVPAPHEIVVESSDTAWVQLRGYRQGAGKTRLGIGFDLLVGLSASQFGAVVAHEMSHARLVQRGFRGVLAKGATRMNRVAAGLTGMEPPPPSTSAVSFDLDPLIWSVVHAMAALSLRMSKAGTRLVAASIRQDEFAADRMAAQICGPHLYRETLIYVHQLSALGARTSWRDRRIRIDSGQGLVPWLQSRLTPTDAEQARSLRERALADTDRHEFDTHPSLAERLAALPLGPSQSGDGQGAEGGQKSGAALDLVADPERLAARLMNEVDQVASQHERKHSSQLHQSIRKRPNSIWKQIGWGLLYSYLFVLFVVGAMTYMSSPPYRGNDRETAASLILIAVLAPPMIIWLVRLAKFQPPEMFSVPSIAQWEAAIAKRTEDFDTGPMEEMAHELRHRTIGSGYKARRETFARTFRDALRTCDYSRALVASHVLLERDPKNIEGILAVSIASAYFGKVKSDGRSIADLIKAHGINPTFSWAMAWTQFLLGEWHAA
jgi:Zn-dependent protease with chaperone function